VRSILFDTDPGVDDALALLYLHRHPDVELAGVTTVAGNGTIETVTRNAQYLADRFGIDAPIARGAAASLSFDAPSPPFHVHGRNGLGDVEIAGEPQHPLDPRPAYRFIVDAVRERPGEITLCAVGKLTNVALALREDPSIAALVRNVVIMGGAFGTDGRSGNITPVAEANIYHDPHAADIVLTAPWTVTVVGLDVTQGVIMTGELLARLRDAGTDEGAFMWDATRIYQEYYHGRDGIDGVYSHDATAAICAVDESPFGFRYGPVRVVTEGIATGLTLQKRLDQTYPPNPWDAAPAQRVAIAVDAARVCDLFAAQFTR
jgi:inosine-uridine nucleoside N-ribohydrolase